MPVAAPNIAPLFPASEIAGFNSRWDTSIEFEFYFLLQSVQVNVLNCAGTGLPTRIVITDFFVFRFKVYIYYLPTEWAVGSDPKDNLHG
jgi:hypothetical protein